MTTWDEEPFTCGCCGYQDTHLVLGSTNTFGGMPDLDFRPPGMARATMQFWVETCPRCGYCAKKVGECEPLAREAVQSRQYAEILGKGVAGEDDSEYPLAKRFEAGAYLCGIEGDLPEQYRHLHSAAWVCDDAEDDETAVRYRHECAEILVQIRATSVDQSDSGETETVLADLFRRTGQFDRARMECHRALEMASPESSLEEGLRLQLDLIARGDRSCHTFPAPPPTPEQLQREEEAKKKAEEDLKRKEERARQQEALYDRVLKDGWKCTHCGREGVAERDFRFSQGPHPCVICRKCGWPQDSAP